MTERDYLDDQELLKQYKQTGNERMLGILLDRYTLLLLGTCMKYLKDEEQARDAVQQVFAKAITELRKYDVTYVKSWLFMIAKNHCLMQLRSKNYRTQSIEDDVADEGFDDMEKLLAYQKKDELINLLHEGLERLNDQQKHCVTYFYLNKKSYREIAEREGISLLQVKSAIQNGKRNIRKWIESVKAK